MMYLGTPIQLIGRCALIGRFMAGAAQFAQKFEDLKRAS